MDKISAEDRSLNMSKIRSKNTGPEKKVRKALWGLGYRYRLNRADLPGKPDIVMGKRKIIIFVHGCFWHWHEGCRKASIPASNTEFWRGKLDGNRRRDREVREQLLYEGWRVLWVWECALSNKAAVAELPQRLKAWIESDEPFGELANL